jgi:hypothetical protein
MVIEDVSPSDTKLNSENEFVYNVQTVNTENDCTQRCNNDPSCNYVFFYNGNQCYIGKRNKPEFVPNTKSNLYIRKKKMNFNENKNPFNVKPNVEKVEKNKDVITVTTRGKDGESVTQSLKLNETNARNTGQALAKLLNTDKLPEDMVSDYVNKFNSNKRVNLVDSYKGGKTVEFFDAPVKKDGVGSKY